MRDIYIKYLSQMNNSYKSIPQYWIVVCEDFMHKLTNVDWKVGLCV